MWRSKDGSQPWHAVLETPGVTYGRNMQFQWKNVDRCFHRKLQALRVSVAYGVLSNLVFNPHSGTPVLHHLIQFVVLGRMLGLALLLQESITRVTGSLGEPRGDP